MNFWQGGVVGKVVILIGLVSFAIGWWAAIREMFYQDRMLGYLGMSVPLVPLVYVALHMDDLKQAFWIQLAGVAGMATGILLDSGAA